MVKVTFQTGSGGLYWAVCEKININSGAGAYLLINVMEDSGGRGPPRLGMDSARVAGYDGGGGLG